METTFFFTQRLMTEIEWDIVSFVALLGSTENRKKSFCPVHFTIYQLEFLAHSIYITCVLDDETILHWTGLFSRWQFLKSTSVMTDSMDMFAITMTSL